jgi:hypothetical protein
MIEDHADVWGHFLHARKLLINLLVDQGQSPGQIASALTMDTMQVVLIAMTDVRLERTAAPPAGVDVRVGFTAEQLIGEHSISRQVKG